MVYIVATIKHWRQQQECFTLNDFKFSYNNAEILIYEI